MGDRDTFNASYGRCATYHPSVFYHGGYNFYYCEADFDDTFNLSAAQVCPECLFCSSECIGDDSFDAGYGNCSTYAEELDYNWGYCDGDYDNVTGLYAFEACMECQRCLPPTTEANTSTAASTEAASTTSPDTATSAPATTTAPAMTASVTLTQAQAEDQVSAAKQGSGVDAGLPLLLLILSAALVRP